MFDRKLIILFGLIVLLSVIDVAANLISFIPILGDIAETISETVLEVIQLVLVGLGFTFAARR